MPVRADFHKSSRAALQGDFVAALLGTFPGGRFGLPGSLGATGAIVTVAEREPVMVRDDPRRGASRIGSAGGRRTL